MGFASESIILCSWPNLNLTKHLYHDYSYSTVVDAIDSTCSGTLTLAEGGVLLVGVAVVVLRS
jgi:hypothetical protein